MNASKPIHWIGSSRKDYRALPPFVQIQFDHALQTILQGEKPPQAKPLKGFGGASVLALREDDPDGTYRVVYTVRIRGAVAILHVFQKKSHRGKVTDLSDIRLVKARLAFALKSLQA